MEREELRRLLKQRPFRPFRVLVSDGRIYDVRYPEMNLLGPSFIKIGIPEPGPNPICDHTEFVRLAQIVRVEPLPDAAPPVAS